MNVIHRPPLTQAHPGAARAGGLSLALASLVLLSGCDMLGIESASVVAARKEAEGRAVGGACRYQGRTIEDCYNQNRKLDKAAIFQGWREMNDYMRENKMESPPPDTSKPETKPEGKAEGKPDAKSEGAAPAKK